MTSIAALAPTLPATGAASGSSHGFQIEIVQDVSDAASVWRDLEREAVMAPYGRHDWIAAYAATEPGASVRAALVRDASGRVAMIVPFCVERRLGLAVGGPAGGKHANFNLPLMRPDVAGSLSGERATALLRDVGRAAGLDLFAWPNVPVAWEGRPNPFAFGGQPSPSDAWSLRLEPDGEATLARSMSSDARKKLRNKVRGLEKLGPVDLLEAGTEADVDAILEAFLRQKEARFRELGIADPFAAPAMRAFIRAGALAGLAEGRPAIELYGLRVGGEIVAVLGGAADAVRLSGMFVSFEAGPAARYSPGEIAVTAVIRVLCRRGRQVFDLGVGDARYKRSICEGVEPLVDVIVPVTARGRLFGAARGTAIALKRRIKASPRAMAALGRAKSGLARLRSA